MFRAHMRGFSKFVHFDDSAGLWFLVALNDGSLQWYVYEVPVLTATEYLRMQGKVARVRFSLELFFTKRNSCAFGTRVERRYFVIVPSRPALAIRSARWL